MATMNPFDLLGDDDAEDPLQLVAAHQPKPAAASAAAAGSQSKKPSPAQSKPAAVVAQPAAKLPSKPLPPAQAVREARSEPRGGGRGGGRGYGRGRGGGGGYSRDSANNEGSFPDSGAPAGQGAVEGGDSGRSGERRGYGGPRGPYRAGSGGGGGGRRVGFSNGEAGDVERPRRAFERRSGTGRGGEVKRDGAGRGNWGTQTDEVAPVAEEANETEKNVGDEKPVGEGEAADANKETPANETEEKEAEEKIWPFVIFLFWMSEFDPKICEWGDGGRRVGFSNGEAGDVERPRRAFERRSGTGRGGEVKRDGAGRGNWGTQTDEVAPVAEEANETEKNVGDEKPVGEGEAADASKETPANETEEKEAEEKEMTLEEYEKVLEEKRKALLTLKTEERKVDAKEFESMQQLSNKKENNDIFIKLGSEKDKRREALEKEEKAKKSVSINEFLKPTEGEKHFTPGGRGRGRGRGSRGGFSGNTTISNVAAPSIEDPSQFPTLGGKDLVEIMMSSDECPKLCPPLLDSAELSTPIHAL
nr:rgg repeats nuclear rna binding protein b [Quercus suber]